MGEQRVLVGSTQTLRSYPRVNVDGEVRLLCFDAVEVRIGTPSTPIPDDDTWTAANIDPINAVITAAADEGDTEIAASETWVRWRRYLVDVDADGEEVIEVAARNSGVPAASLLLDEPLPCAIESGGRVRGWECSIELTSDQTEFAGDGIAVWKGTLDGVDYTWTQSFRIVRRMPASTLTPSELTKRFSILNSWRAVADFDFEDLLHVAWEDEIEEFLEAHHIAVENITTPDVLDGLHALACLYHVASSHPAVSQEHYERIEKRWVDKKATTLGRRDLADAVQDVDPAPRPPEPPTIRNVTRLVR